MSRPLHIWRYPTAAFWAWKCKPCGYGSYATSWTAALRYALWHCAKTAAEVRTVASVNGEDPGRVPPAVAPSLPQADSGPAVARAPSSPASGGRGEGRTTHV